MNPWKVETQIERREDSPDRFVCKNGSKQLCVRDLRFSYKAPSGNEAPFRIGIDSMEVRTGEVHALIGPNGCGKSTLLRLVCRLLPFSSGRVQLDGADLDSFSESELARQIAFLPQQVAPAFSLPVEEVVMMGRHPWMKGLGLATPEDTRITDEAMKRMDVARFRGRPFDSLSGGERQRVLLASILAQGAQMILLDEPTSALDIHHQAEVFHLLRAEAKRGAGILVVTHDLTLAGHFADRITLMKGGVDVCSGPPMDVLEQSRLRAIYGEQVRVIADPDSNLPCVLPTLEQSPQRPLKEEFPRAASKTKAVHWPDTMELPELPPAAMVPSRPTLTFGRWVRVLILFAVGSLGAVALAPFFGAEPLNLVEGFRNLMFGDGEDLSAMLLALRLPRIVMGLLAGMALAGVGACFQSLLRNPLAEPYTLGIASASSLGAVIAISFPVVSFELGFFSGVQVWALAFAMVTVAFLWSVSQPNRLGQGMTGLLLTGLLLGLMSSGCILLVRFLASPLTVRAMDQWMLGGMDIAGWRDVLPCFLFLISGFLLLLWHARDLNQIEWGDEVAKGRGVDVTRVQRSVLVGGSLATAAVVSVVGPIGFVGLLVPHVVRRWVGSDQRLVLPASMMMGGAVLVLADTVARSLSIGGRGSELPVGILTSLIGGPIFLLFLLRGKSGLFRGPR